MLNNNDKSLIQSCHDKLKRLEKSITNSLNDEQKKQVNKARNILQGILDDNLLSQLGS